MDIPLSTIWLSSKDMEYATEALRSGWISGMGEFLMRFEEGLGKRIYRRHVIAVANGTVALELALRALGIRAGDEVIVPAFTFVAPAAAVRAVGATPVFADIHPDHWTLDPLSVANRMTRRTQAIIAVDVLGHPCDYDALQAVAGTVPIIEDAAEAHGACYKGRPVGSFGTISTFSFHANKTVTTGEGGCVATDDDHLAQMMRLIANHGMTKQRPYHHEVVGTNYRMTNLTAAIGVGQVERWDSLVEARREVATHYDEHLQGVKGLRRRPVAEWAKEACWLYTLAHQQREKILSSLRGRYGVDARAIWELLPDQLPYRDVQGSYPVARQVASEAFWLPTFANMPREKIRKVANAIQEILTT
jgi:perosamine synthetase